MQDIELFGYVSLRTKPELAGKIFTLVNIWRGTEVVITALTRNQMVRAT